MIAPLTAWMSWEAGVDLVACTRSDLAMPNIIVHVARLVHTPLGSAPAGMVLVQPDPAAAPLVIGFVCPDPKIGAYFGPRIFADTPFAGAPALPATITIATAPDSVGATVLVGGHEIRTELDGLGTLALVHREPAPMTPFWQQGIEAPAASARLWLDGREIPLVIPPVGITGGPAAVSAPCGLYAR